MLDRAYLDRFDFNDRWGGLDAYRLRSAILLKAIQRAVALGCGDDAAVLAALRRLTDDDVEGDFEVRQAARDALGRLQPKTE
jgi:HEAT repeat protein